MQAWVFRSESVCNLNVKLLGSENAWIHIPSPEIQWKLSLKKPKTPNKHKKEINAA